jgi:hypothetical protein
MKTTIPPSDAYQIIRSEPKEKFITLPSKMNNEGSNKRNT